MNDYEISARNKVKRVPDRGHYDSKTVYAILDDGFLCHLGFSIDGQTFVIPTLYGRKDNKVYIHGAASSRMLRNTEKGLPVCLTVTHVDGLVLARSAFHHSMNYRSVVIFGQAKKVEGEEKYEALKVISDHIIKGRWDEVREPSAKELKATSVLAIDIQQASAKIRQGPPSDDKEDYNLDVWAGVIPTVIAKGQPIADELLEPGIKLDASVTNFLKN